MPSAILGVRAVTGKQEQVGPLLFCSVFYSSGGDMHEYKNYINCCIFKNKL